MRRHKKEKPWAVRFSVSVLAVLFWIGVWYLLASLANRTLLLKIPLPWETLMRFFRDLGQLSFWKAAGLSLGRIALGFGVAFGIGTLMALAGHVSPVFRSLCAPLLPLIRSVPVAAFIFLAWLWIPSRILPSFIAALMVLPVIWSHAVTGLEAMDVRYAEMGKVFGWSEREIWLKIRLPLLAPPLRTGCLTGIGIAWKAGVAAEVICSPSGCLGALLQKEKTDIDYVGVFAVTLAVVLLSLGLEVVLKLLWKEKPYGAHR